MIRFLFIAIITIFLSCNESPIKLNNEVIRFVEFPTVDSIKFESLYSGVLNEPYEMLYEAGHLLMRCKDSSEGGFLFDYSILEDTVNSRGISYGMAPNEMLSCDISRLNEKVWIYDIGKQRIGFVSFDSIWDGNYSIERYYNVPRSFYSVAMLNDSIMIGTNDITESKKLSFLNLYTGNIEGKASYAYLNEKIPNSALIDAASCYINIHPITKDIVLAYRYMDILEFYDCNGVLKYSIQGPENIELKFAVNSSNTMKKIPQTRKAFVSSYITNDKVYLLYSGCKRIDDNWSNGMELHVYSWNGEPLNRYLLEEPLYAFAINELGSEIYSYSLQTGEIIKGYLR